MEEGGSANLDDGGGAPVDAGTTAGECGGSSVKTSDDKENPYMGDLEGYVPTPVDLHIQAVYV